MPTECAFDSFNAISDGVYVYAYTPTEKLRPDTVTAEAFIAASNGTKTQVEKAVYYPGDNLVRLFLGDDLYAKKINISSESLLSLDGTLVSCNETGYAMPYIYPGYEDISITGTAVYQNGSLVLTLKDKINAQIRVSVVNATGVAYEDKEIIVKKSDGSIIAVETFDIGEYETKEVSIFTRNYVFDSNEIIVYLR